MKLPFTAGPFCHPIHYSVLHWEVMDAEGQVLATCLSEVNAKAFAHTATQHYKLIDMVICLLSELEQELLEQGGCDHEVGICACSRIALMESAKTLLKQQGIEMDVTTPWAKGLKMSDGEINEIYRRIAVKEEEHGGFLTDYANAVIRADQENFDVLKSMSVWLIWKYKLKLPEGHPPVPEDRP